MIYIFVELVLTRRDFISVFNGGFSGGRVQENNEDAFLLTYSESINPNGYKLSTEKQLVR